jgi:hypothetical protein
MKQIEFNAELIGKPGIVVKYRNGDTPDFVKAYTVRGTIRSIDNTGFFGVWHTLDGKGACPERDLIMYRETRTAEEVAKELYLGVWGFISEVGKAIRIKCVQAGMDEMKGGSG